MDPNVLFLKIPKPERAIRTLKGKDSSVFPASFYLAFFLFSGVLLTIWLHIFVVRQSDAERRIYRYTNIIWEYAEQYGVPTELVKSVIRVESKGRPDALSERGAVGLMQITPLTLKHVRQEYGIEAGDLFQPEYNIRIGTAYLNWLFQHFHNDIYLVLAAYHAGPSAVRKWVKAMPPGHSSRKILRTQAYPATLQYINAVTGKNMKRMPQR